MAAAVPIVVWPKDPQAVLDYTIDWSKWLRTDSILTVAWTLDAGVSNAGQYNSPTTTTIWVSGGVDGNPYLLTCKVVTLGGRVERRTFQLNAGDR